MRIRAFRRYIRDSRSEILLRDPRQFCQFDLYLTLITGETTIMYGLLLENTLFFLKKIASEPRYLEIVVATGLLSDSEGTGKDLAINITFTYPEAIIPRVVKKASIILGISEVDIMEG